MKIERSEMEVDRALARAPKRVPHIVRNYKEAKNDKSKKRYSGISGRPWMSHERCWTAVVVARITERPGAKAKPTRP